MPLTRLALIMVALAFTFGCRKIADSDMATMPQPPQAKRIAYELEKHGHRRTDYYYWLRERQNPEVTAYLESENTYTGAVMAHTEVLQKELFAEIKGRIKQSDESVPFKKGDFYYYTRFEEGRDYPLYCRRRGSMNTSEVILLDANQLAEGHEFLSLRGLSPYDLAISSSQDILAYALDTRGRVIYTIYFLELSSGKTLAETISAVNGNLVWANDNKTLFYTRQDPISLRPHRVYRHVIGTDPAEDPIVYDERDEEFSVRISKSRSERYILIHASQTDSDEVLYVDAGAPESDVRVLLARKDGHEYAADHFDGRFLIRTNRHAANFRLVEVTAEGPAEETWRELVPHREDVLLQGFEAFRNYLVLFERREGLVRLRIIPWSEGDEHEIDFEDPAYEAHLGPNPSSETSLLRYVYTSLVTPESTYDFDMSTAKKTLLKRDEVLGGFNPAGYVTERLEAEARDGTAVPISLFYRRGTELNGENPLLLYGYGSYGASMDAAFDADVLSLVDRGFVYAIAHVRGGQEMGRRWYEAGRLLNKKNTFTDFIDCAEYLCNAGYTGTHKLFAMGASAGGLLVGAVFHMRPDLFKGVIAQVPFVDVVTTMLDESIPLTTSEYDEWGNPNDETYYDYMLSYSPYDSVAAVEYPHLLVTTSLHDPWVQYWEPAKWVAKLRSTATGSNRLLLKTNMNAGHSGASGRTQRYAQTAFEYAFILDILAGAE